MTEANFSGFSAPQNPSTAEMPHLPLGIHRPIPLYSTQQFSLPNVLMNADALSLIAAQSLQSRSDQRNVMSGTGMITCAFLMKEDTKEERKQQREAWLARQYRQLHHLHEKQAEKAVKIIPALSPPVAPPRTPELPPHNLSAVAPPPQQVGMRLRGIPKKTRAKPHKFTDPQLDFLRNVYQTNETPTIDEAYELSTQLGIEGDKIYSWFVRERQRMRREKGMEGKIRRKKDKAAAS